MSHNETTADFKDSGYDKIYTTTKITFLTHIDVSKVLPMIWDYNSILSSLSPGLQKILVAT